MTISVKLVGQWAAGREAFERGALLRAAIDKAVLKQAMRARALIVSGMSEQAPGGRPFKPLSPFTLAARRLKGFRGSKALLVSGSLRNAITATAAGAGRAFVGVLRTARGKSGGPLVNVARIQEEGRTFAVKVTPKMRRWLMAVVASMGDAEKKGRATGQLAKGVIIVRIPARPYIAPVVEKMAANPEAIRRQLAADIAQELGGYLGKP